MSEVKSSILDKLPPLQISSTSSASAAPLPSSSSTSSHSNGVPSPSSSLFPQDRSVWHSLLSRASRRHVGVSPVSTLIVLGDATSGKSSLLSKFTDRVSSNVESSEYLIDYSYCNVRNRHNADKEEILSQMNVWQLDDANHAGTMHSFLRATRDRERDREREGAASPNGLPLPTPASPTTAASSPSSEKSPSPYSSHFSSSADVASLESSLFVITVDVSEPWKAIETLHKWLAVLTKFKEAVWTKLTANEQKVLTDKLAIEVQSYYNADLRVAVAAGKGETAKAASPTASSPAPAANGEDAPVAQLDPNVPKINLGLSIVIVGTKADSFSRHLQSKSGLNVDERMEFLVRRLRQVALNYGAALFFTSAAGRGPGTNVEQLQSYIYHRIYNFPKTETPPKVVATEDDFALSIPTGFDSKNLIESIQSKFNDDTPFEEVFKNPAKSSKAVKQVGTEAVKAQDNVLFFKNLKFSLESGVGPTMGLSSNRQTSGATAAAAAKPAEQKTAAVPPSAATVLSPSNGGAPSLTPAVPSSSSASAAAAAVAAANMNATSKMNPKGQQAVKQFFKNLLNSNPGGPATDSSDAKTVRANAEKELKKMTGEQS